MDELEDGSELDDEVDGDKDLGKKLEDEGGDKVDVEGDAKFRMPAGTHVYAKNGYATFIDNRGYADVRCKLLGRWCTEEELGGAVAVQEHHRPHARRDAREASSESYSLAQLVPVEDDVGWLAFARLRSAPLA